MVSKEFNPSISSPLYFIRKALYLKIKQYAPMLKGRVLDFGCGSKPYKSLFENASYYIGVDFNSEGHSHENEQIDFFYDGKTLPFQNEEFDNIFCSEVFEHVFNLPEILKELNRVVKPKGEILFTCPFVWEEHEMPIDYARYTRFALRDLLTKNGFEVVVEDKSGHFASAIHQMFVLYINYHWINKVAFFSRFTIFKKAVRQVFVPLLNILFYAVEPILPKSQYLYLNNVIIAKKL